MSRSDRIVVAAGGGALVLVLAAASILLIPPVGGADAPRDATGLVLSSPPTSAAPSFRAEDAVIVVDVEGGVLHPGIRELPAGSRVADAIAAAGGYSSDVDLAAMSAAINLAQPLADGEQIVVPRIGEAAVGFASAPTARSGGIDEPGAGALVNLNTATPEELEALPGIGAVTVQKIVAARQEQPFASLEDAVERGVIHRGQLEDIQGLATAG